MRLAGLSIESGAVRACIINRVPGRTAIVRNADFELKSGSEGDRADKFLTILRQLREEDGVRGVVVGVGMTYFTHHFVTLPLVKRPDIMHALGFELEKHLPLPPEEYLYDFTTVSRSEEGSDLLVLAALRCKLDWISKACEIAGVVLLGIRCTAMEAMNEFAAENEADGVRFIYRGADATSVLGLKETAPVELKVLRKGSSPTESDLRSFSEKYDMGAFSVSEQFAEPMEDSKTTELVYDIPHILAKSAFRKRRFDLQFASATGGSAVPLWHQQAPQVLAVLCVLIFLLTSVVSYYKDSSALRRINTELTKAKEQSEPLMTVRDELNSLSARRQYLEEYISARSKHIKALRELSSRLPSSAWLTGMSMDENGKIQLQGYAARASEIIRPLDSSSLFKNVEFASPVTISEGRERFSIHMEMER